MLLGIVTSTQTGGLAAAQGNPEARPASTRSTLIGIIASRMRQYRRTSRTLRWIFDAVMAASDRSGPASLPCLLQRRSQGKLILTRLN